MTRTPQPRHTAAFAQALAAALVIVATGCTICPDPFDYTGPVPDGSAPQNDFRARASGIVPLGSHPVPWPPVVRAAEPAGDEPHAMVAATGEPAPGVTNAVADETPAVLPAAAEADAEPAADPPAGDDAVAPAAPVIVEPTIDEILPPVQAPRPEASRRKHETPGWRTRD